MELVFEQSLRSESRSYDVDQHMADFFVSYTSADKAWAEWIGYVLEEEGFAVDIQVWDFRPGNNFVLEMQRAATEADRTIMVLSPDYLKSQFASPEWALHSPRTRRGSNANWCRSWSGNVSRHGY